MRVRTGVVAVGLAALVSWAACGGPAGDRPEQAGEAEGVVEEAGAAPEEAADTTRPPAGALQDSSAARDTPSVAQDEALPRLEPPTADRIALEFARPITDQDLRWLEENDFRVDTVLSETLVIGWLASPKGERIAHDPRVARIHPLMR